MKSLSWNGFSTQFVVLIAVGFSVMSSPRLSAAMVGSVFVSGHDSDFHAALGPSPAAAQHIIQDALTFARNGNTAPILYIESDLSNLSLGDHTDSEPGLIASGYTAGTTVGNHYVKVNSTVFATLNLSLYSALFIPSDHGGTLTGNDLQALDARSTDILAYINAGGGLVAFSEDGNHRQPTSGPAPALFGFLPFLVSSTAFSEAESGNTLTAEGISLGLSTSDINGNFSHNVFTATGGMNVVDRDRAGDILSLDFRGQISSTGVGVPEPSTGLLIGISVAVFLIVRRLRNGQSI